MGRKNSLAKNSIQMLCVMQHLDEQNLYERSKLLLSIYRNVCWTACDRAAMLREEAEYCYGRELEEGLLYLNDFAPTVEREKFEETVKSLFQTKWLVELVDSAMVKMRDFPYSPQLYFDIVFKCYLSRFRYTEPELLETLRMERSTYYDRKKEAIKIFGLSLWGSALPQIKQALEEPLLYEYEYPYGGGARKEYMLALTPENLANFIGARGYDAKKIVITDVLDRLIVNTCMGMLDVCPDQKLCGRIIEYLAPIQLGEKEAGEILAVERNVADEYFAMEDEEVTMAECQML